MRGRALRRTALQGLVLAGAALVLPACSPLGYYWQSVQGHTRILLDARALDDWIANPDTAAHVAGQLAAAREIRRFAVDALALPDNASYSRYAELGRPYVVWNVVAAPPWSLELQTWCFPVAGCVGYRGYFDEAQAQAEAALLRSRGLEVRVYGVPAYSTLGWLNWLGGDPLLSSFIQYPPVELARLLFHELAHQVVYVAGDTAFNESFATAVERLGAAQWLAATPQAGDGALLQRRDARRTEFRALVLATRERLAALYKRRTEAGLDDAAAQAAKDAIVQQLRADYESHKLVWLAQPGTPADAFAGWDRWVAEANNAALGAFSAYEDLVPAFEALHRRVSAGASPRAGWLRFYAAVRELAALPDAERVPALRARALGG